MYKFAFWYVHKVTAYVAIVLMFLVLGFIFFPTPTYNMVGFAAANTINAGKVVWVVGGYFVDLTKSFIEIIPLN